MRVLLPPSETKKSGGGNTLFDTQKLLFNETLREHRQEVVTVLAKLSTDLETAKKALKVGDKAAATIKNNLTLAEQTTLPAVERYTGVLFDAIAYNSLEDQAKKWIADHVLIQSALFGLISASDEIPNYRLSAGSTLTNLKKSLKQFWVAAHKDISLEDHFVLDMRSKVYAALAPISNAYTVEVYDANAPEQKRSLNHFNKKAKGDLVAKLARSSAEITSVDSFLEWASDTKLQININDQTLELFTTIGAPSRA